MTKRGLQFLLAMGVLGAVVGQVPGAPGQPPATKPDSGAVATPDSGAAAVATPTLVDGWQRVTISSPGPTWDRRTPRQDLAWMGGNRVLAAWISAPSANGVSSSASGPLSARFFNIDGDWSSAPRLIQENARGVQALATGPIDRGPCEVSPRGVGPGTGTSHAFRSFLAVYGGTGVNTGLKVHQVDWCGATIKVTLVRTLTTARLGAMAGRRVCSPAVCTQTILVVYDRAGLRGRLMNGQGDWLGGEFVIDDDVGERRYIDITWNPVARRFYVGYNVIGNGFKECSIRQASVMPSGTASFVKVVADTCDPLMGGHRSSSATDDNMSRNPRGRYLWYFQPAGGNNVHLMNNRGEVRSRLDLGQGANLELPLPVSLANVHESGPVSYATAVHFVGAAIRPQHAFVTLAKGGAVLSSQAAPQGETLATEALASLVVTGTGPQCFPGVQGQCPSWFLSAYDL